MYDLITTRGVIGRSQTEYERRELRLFRTLDDGGDTITIYCDENEIAYIIPTASIVEALEAESK